MKDALRIEYVPGVCIEDIPDKIAQDIWPNLTINGGNCISVEKKSKFGEWLIAKNVKFYKSWQWIVVWR